MIRAAAKARRADPAERRLTEDTPAGLGPAIEIALEAIVAVDPCNARRVEPRVEDIAALAEDIAAHGLLNPLIVRGEPGCYRVLAGSRRWRALRKLGEATVRARVFDGADEDAAILSLAENVARDDLHPLDEADRVAELARNARPEAVARRLAKSTRWVRERLALSTLPEAARAAWFAGEIGLVEARALSVGESDAVEALLARPDARAVLSDPRAIRAALLPKGVSSRTPAAIFVGVDDYVFAGGALHEDLFEDESWFLDSALLRRLERQKLAEIADRLCAAEGWGHVLFEPGDALDLVTPHYTTGELMELDAIETAPVPTPDQIARGAEIVKRASLRVVAESERAHFGVYVGLDSEGRLDVTRGVKIERPNETVDRAERPPQTPLRAVDAAASGPPDGGRQPPRRDPPRSEARAPRAGQDDAPILHADARRLADMAASRAAADLIGAGLAGDAMRLALAAMLAKGRTALGVSRLQGPGGRAGALARKLAGLEFAPALGLLGEASDDEVEQAFVEAVAGAVDFRGADEATNRALLDFLDRLEEDGAASIAASRKIDFPAFFAAAGRAFCLIAIRDCAGPAGESERAWMNDEALAKEAALLARAKDWLPRHLRRAA